VEGTGFGFFIFSGGSSEGISGSVSAGAFGVAGGAGVKDVFFEYPFFVPAPPFRFRDPREPSESLAASFWSFPLLNK
jgi:hypothetical protein